MKLHASVDWRNESGHVCIRLFFASSAAGWRTLGMKTAVKGDEEDRKARPTDKLCVLLPKQGALRIDAP